MLLLRVNRIPYSEIRFFLAALRRITVQLTFIALFTINYLILLIFCANEIHLVKSLSHQADTVFLAIFLR